MGKIQQKIIRHIKAENKKYSNNLIKLDLKDLPPRKGVIFPDELWRSNRFVVQVFFEDFIRLSINRTMVDDHGDWLEGITWDELQKIKNQCGYKDKAAVELFPPVNDLVNVANLRHLFILKELPSYLWKEK